MMRALAIFVVCLASYSPCTFSAAVPATTATTSPSLLAQYQQLKAKLATSIFGSPILLNSNIGNDSAKGEVFALLETPFAVLRNTLSQPAQWCELAILHVNIKTCLYHAKQVEFFIGRKYYQPPDEAFPLQYHFDALASTDEKLNVTLTAAEGPFGTSDYLTKLQAIPIDSQHSFIRFTYRYNFGFMAKLGMQTYLATLGRNKVGFTVTGTDNQGNRIYVKGLQGVIERNVMRYIFAIQSVLEAKKSLAEYNRTAAMVRWYAHIQKHPRQLVELSREEYMNNKQRELKNQLVMQKTTQP